MLAVRNFRWTHTRRVPTVAVMNVSRIALVTGAFATHRLARGWVLAEGATWLARRAAR